MVSFIFMLGLTLAPLVVKVNPNINVVLTACLTLPLVIHPEIMKYVQETMPNEHAMRFLLAGSAMLLAQFLLFKFLAKDLVSAVLTCYFFVLGIVAFSVTLLPAINRFLPKHWNDDLIVWHVPYFRGMLYFISFLFLNSWI
ncbi:unnamed protein product, partial [Musa acuminata var. zebrina]